MSQTSGEMENYLRERLSQLTTLPRDSHKAAVGRERYCIQVAELIKGQEVVHAVSKTPFQRLNEWISSIRNPLFRKERFSMFTTISTVLIAISMLFGGAGATVLAAQESQPDDFLYPVKTFSEDAQIILAGNPQSQLDLLMTFTDRRTAEIAFKQTAGEQIQEAVVERFENELNHMFRIANGMEDDLMVQALEHIAIHMRKHEREMERLREAQPDKVDPLMEQVREMLRLRVYLAELGIQDPPAFRNQLQQMLRERTGVNHQGEGAKPDEGNGLRLGPVEESPCLDCPKEEGSGFGPGPSNRAEDTHPDDGYGPQDPQGCNGCQQEGGDGDRGQDFNPPKQEEKSSSNKLQEQNSEQNGNNYGGESNQNGGQQKSNPGSSK